MSNTRRGVSAPDPELLLIVAMLLASALLLVATRGVI
jgi:hypothetical protein